MVMPWKAKSSPLGMRRVEWFGDGMFSEVRGPANVLELRKQISISYQIALKHNCGFLLQSYTESLLTFRNFNRCFCKNSFASLPIYKEAIYQIIEVGDQNAFVTKSKHLVPPPLTQNRRPDKMFCHIKIQT